MSAPLHYTTMERLKLPRPVDRVGFIAERCRGRRVLDIGCLDETALKKRDTETWLHGRIAGLAAKVTGIDNSERLPADGLVTASNARIYRGNGLDPQVAGLDDAEIEVIVAGEFIEHIESPLAFFEALRARFPGREVLISTPNASGFGNTLLGLIGREAQHPDHIHLFSYKILNTLSARAGFTRYEILPYRFYATELMLSLSPLPRAGVWLVERFVRMVERIFPLLSFGYVVRAEL